MLIDCSHKNECIQTAAWVNILACLGHMSLNHVPINLILRFHCVTYFLCLKYHELFDKFYNITYIFTVPMNSDATHIYLIFKENLGMNKSTKLSGC